MNNYDFGKANFDSVKKVAEYFAKVGPGTPTSADAMGLSGSFMMSLVNRRAVRIVGKKEIFYPVGGDLYRRGEANLYVLEMTPKAFWEVYVRCVEDECKYKRREAESYVACAKQKLTEVEHLLDKLRSVNF